MAHRGAGGTTGGSGRGQERALLTHRERDVVALVLESLSRAEIARILGLKTSSVEVYLSRLYRRVGIRSRVELALRAEREHWLDPA